MLRFFCAWLRHFFEVDESRLRMRLYLHQGLDLDEATAFWSELTDREQKVVRLRFGLEDGQARTLEEVGKEFGVTRERIRQIESKTLAKLRHPIRSQKLRDYLDDE